ncbi:MAG: CotH kinase family protein [Saprospiraceae bacterium]|nr:CotH kinase family protein [Saprospiraceae bacterium]
MKRFLLAFLVFASIEFSLDAQNFTNSKLPIFVVNTSGGAQIVDEPKTIAHLGVIWNGDGAINYLTDPFTDYDGQIGIEIRGSSSQWFPKNNFAMETQNADSTSNNVSVLGFPKENDWVLHGPYSDKTLMRNALAFTLGSWIMPYAPRVRDCELVINGDYRGVYVSTAKIKQDDNRVNTSKSGPDENAGDDLTGGYILKFDKFDGLVSDGFPSAYPASPGGVPGGTVYQYHYPKPDEITPPQKAYIQNYIANFEDIMSSPDFADTVSGYRSMLDVPSVIQMIFIQEISRNVDGYRLSTFMYKDRDSVDSRLHLGPVWDFNLGFSNVDYCIGPGYQGWAIDFNDFCPGDYWVVHFWWKRLWQDPLFVKQMKQEWASLRASTLSNEHIFHLVDSLENMLQEPAQRNFVRWPTLHEYVWPNPVITGSYQGEVDRMRTWLTNRLAWMDGAMLALVDTVVVVEPPIGGLVVKPTLFHDEVNFWLDVVGYQRISLEVFDAHGRTIHTQTGFYDDDKVARLTWNAYDLPAGAYFYKLKVGKKPHVVGKLMKY